MAAPTTAHAQEPDTETTTVAPATPDRLEIKLLQAPVDRQGDPRGQIYIVDHVAPGATIIRTVGLVNHSPAPLRVTAYAGAAEVHGAEFRFGADAGGNELAEWTTVEPGHLELAPGAQAPGTLTIRVPTDAPPGERYAVAWAEMTSTPPVGGGVRHVNRVGIRIYLSVGPGGEPASAFTISRMQTTRDDEGRITVTATIRNTGKRALDLAGELTLHDGPAGLDARPFRAVQSTTLAIGASTELMIPLDERIPSGPWEATLTLTSGRTERTRTDRVVLPGDTDTNGGPSAPWPLGAALLVAAAAVHLRRRLANRGRWRRATPRRT
jgi:hypothetical protein